MTRQEMFDKAYIGVIAQGGPSVNDHDCAYRGHNGRACVVGQLVTDEVAAILDSLTTLGIDDILDVDDDAPQWEWLPPYFRGEADVLGELQSAHDGAYFEAIDGTDEDFLEAFRKRMASVADKYGLTVPEVPV